MFFVLDENKNLVEAYSKEDVLALLERAIEDGDLASVEEDSAFVSKFKSLYNGTTHHLEFVTQAQYNALNLAGELVPNTYYFITDDTSYDDLMAALDALSDDLDSTKERVTSCEDDLADIKDGSLTIPSAENSEKINNLEITRDTNGLLKIGDIIIPQKQLIWEGSQNLNDGLTISNIDPHCSYEIWYTTSDTSESETIAKKFTISGKYGTSVLMYSEMNVFEIYVEGFAFNPSNPGDATNIIGYYRKSIKVSKNTADNSFSISNVVFKSHEAIVPSTVCYIKQIYKVFDIGTNESSSGSGSGGGGGGGGGISTPVVS